MRKQQSDFGWDWGPAFAPAGPWLPGRVVQLDPPETHIIGSTADIYREGQRNNQAPDQSAPWVMNCSVEYIGAPLDMPGILISVLDDSSQSIVTKSLSKITTQAGIVSGVTIIDSELFQDPRTLWWPNGDLTPAYVRVAI